MTKEGASIAHIAADMNVLQRAISDLNPVATGLPDSTIPTRKSGTGMKKKIPHGTNAVLPRDVMLNPSITTTNLKNKLPMLLQDISIRTIKHRPQKNITSLMMKRGSSSVMITCIGHLQTGKL